METNKDFSITIDSIVIHTDCTEQEADSWFEFHETNARYNQTDEAISLMEDGEVVKSFNYSDWLQSEKEEQEDYEGSSHYYESKYEAI